MPPTGRLKARSSGSAGIIEANEQVIFPSLPGDRHPAAGDPLPDLPSHRGVPARQSQRGPDRALPPCPPRSTRHLVPVASALPHYPVDAAAWHRSPRAGRARPGGEFQWPQSAAIPRRGPHIEPIWLAAAVGWHYRAGGTEPGVLVCRHSR